MSCVLCFDILDASELLSAPTMTTKMSLDVAKDLGAEVSTCSQTPSSDSQFYGEKLTSLSQQKVKVCSKTCSWTQTLRWCGEVALVTHFATTTNAECIGTKGSLHALYFYHIYIYSVWEKTRHIPKTPLKKF